MIKLPDLTPTNPSKTLPRIGLEQAIEQPKLKTDEALQLRQMALDHLRVPVDFNRPDWFEWLTVGLSEAKRLQTTTLLAVTFARNPPQEQEFLRQALDWLNPTADASVVLDEGTQYPLPPPSTPGWAASLQAAGWLLEQLARLAQPEPMRVTLLTTKGPRGVLEGIDPETAQGQVFPTGLLLKALANWTGAECTPLDLPDSNPRVSCLWVHKDNRGLLLIANQSPNSQTLWLPESLQLPAPGWQLNDTLLSASSLSGQLPESIPFTNRELPLAPFALVGLET